MPFRLMFPNAIVITLHRITLESKVACHIFRTAKSSGNNFLLLRQRSNIIKTVHIIRIHIRFLHLDSVFFCQSIRRAKISLSYFPIILPSYTVTYYFHRINRALQLCHVFSTRLLTHNIAVNHIKIRVKLNNRMFLSE